MWIVEVFLAQGLWKWTRIVYDCTLSRCIMLRLHRATSSLPSLTLHSERNCILSLLNKIDIFETCVKLVWPSNFSGCISIYYIPIIHVHRLTRGILCECHMTLRLVINKRPRSPAFPFVSSIESSLSIKTSPERIRICLRKKMSHIAS